MLADQRKQIILDQVNLNHSVTVARNWRKSCGKWDMGSKTVPGRYSQK